MQYRHISEKQRFFAAGARECTLRIKAAKNSHCVVYGRILF